MCSLGLTLILFVHCSIFVGLAYGASTDLATIRALTIALVRAVITCEHKPECSAAASTYDFKNILLCGIVAMAGLLQKVPDDVSFP